MRTSLFLLLVWLVLDRPGIAHAYIDPGTGSYLVQVVLSFVFGGAIALKQILQRLRLVKRSSQTKDGEDDDE